MSVAVYLLLGDDEERKARGVEKLRRGRNAESYDASETSPEAVVSTCNSYSLFGEGPFVVVRNLDAWNAAQKAVIVAYLEDPAPEADLVLVGKKLGARERLLAAAKRSGEVHSFEQPTGKALVRWLAGHAGGLGLDLPEDVAEGLIERCSGDKQRLANETEKLALYVAGRPAIHEDVEALCPPDVQSNIFAFVDSLGAGDRARAVELLEDLMSTGEPPLRLTYMVRRQFRLVARARALFARGVSQGEVAKELKVPPFVARKLEEQGSGMSDEDLERALALVLDLERGLKGGSDLGDELQVELAVLKLSG
ncbi:MAG: DNA polymerase III subunit delta, partial [Actinomycetota bacterium]|nr:DNA polymerase III subunit delta [Actinomycetota bacterium]